MYNILNGNFSNFYRGHFYLDLLRSRKIIFRTNMARGFAHLIRLFVCILLDQNLKLMANLTIFFSGDT